MTSDTTTPRALCLGGCGSTKTRSDDYAEGETAMTPLAGDGLCHDCAKRLGTLVALQTGRLEIDPASSAWLTATRAARDEHQRATGRATR